MFYRNDLLQRHLILKHKKGSRKAPDPQSDRAPSKELSHSPADPTIPNVLHEQPLDVMAIEPLENLEPIPQSPHHGPEGSPASSLSRVSHGLSDPLLQPIQTSEAFPALPLENYGYNFAWMYQASTAPALDVPIQEGPTSQVDFTQVPVSHTCPAPPLRVV